MEEAPKKFVFKAKPAMMNGEPYVATPVNDKKDALKAVLSIVMAHTADVFHGIVDAISDHYKIDKDEMMDVIMSHPAYNSIICSPVLNDLGYLSKPDEPAPAPVPKKSTTKKVGSKPQVEPVPTSTEPAPAEPAPVKKRFIIKKKATTKAADSLPSESKDE